MPRCYLVKKVKYFGIRDWGQLGDAPPPASPSEASVAPNSPSPSYTQLGQSSGGGLSEPSHSVNSGTPNSSKLIHYYFYT